jgi:hypothetical protein
MLMYQGERSFPTTSKFLDPTKGLISIPDHTLFFSRDSQNAIFNFYLNIFLLQSCWYSVLIINTTLIKYSFIQNNKLKLYLRVDFLPGKSNCSSKLSSLSLQQYKGRSFSISSMTLQELNSLENLCERIKWTREMRFD